MQVPKDSEERKWEYLDKALELFHEKGYEKTTINDIIQKVGVSKGAFYHYFQSKEEVIETIAKIYAENTARIIRNISERKDLTALEKVNMSITRVQEYKAYHAEKRLRIHEIFVSEENIKLQHKILDNFKEQAFSSYKTIINQGIKEGVFNTSYVEEAVELLIDMMGNLNYVLAKFILEIKNDPDVMTSVKRKLEFYEESMERIMQAKKGSIKLARPIIERIQRF